MLLLLPRRSLAQRQLLPAASTATSRSHAQLATSSFSSATGSTSAKKNLSLRPTSDPFKCTKLMSTMPTLTLDNMNPAIIKMEYAVRGPLVIRATEIEKELEKVREKNA